ncbi:hypothetical protein ACQ4PT_042574 [Festuca glaucescens]
MEPRSPGSPGSASSVRPIVSGLGFSGSSTASPEEVSSGRVEGTAPVGGVRGPIQDRLVWEQPKLSRKARWRRRKQLQKRRFVDSPLPRLISPGTEDACFKCLQPGHYKRGCTNEQVCISCAEEGHGSGGCKRPRSPVSEEELRRKAMAAVALRRAAGNQPGGRGLGAPAARQPGAASQRSPAGDLRAFPSQRSPPPGPGAPRDTVQGVLDSSCSVVAMAPETASREDLGTFKVESWTADPEDIPTERELWVPEPSLLAGDVPSSSSCPSPVRRDSEKRLLLYRILIHVSRIDEFCELEGQRPSARVGLQRRDETGLPEADVAGEPGEGFWTSRDVTWVAGILDRRGSGDYGRRRLAGGEVAWRLPHVVGQCFRDQRIRSASIVAEEQLSVVPGGAGRGTGVEASVRGVVEQRQPSVGLDQGNSVQVASCGSAEINPNADLGQAAAELGRDAGTSPLEAGSGDKSTQVSEQQSSAVSLTESSSSAPLDPSVAREPLMEAPRFIQYGSEEFVQISVGSDLVTDQGRKEACFFEAYNKLLGEIQVRDNTIDLDKLELPHLDLHDVDAIFSEEEVWGVIRELPPDRAPGPDGFIGAFFQKAWPVIKNDVMAIVLKLFVGDGRGFGKLNKALIMLIPKKAEAKEIGDYRPISLVHSMAKLFSKILANRVRPRLGDLVSPNQSAFIRGRSLHDNFILVRQVARKINSKKIPGVLIKLDITRAFDSLSWPFLMEVLSKFGFSDIFRRLACTEQLFSPIPGVMPLQRLSVFADDAVLFVKPLPSDLLTVRYILDVFGHASGLRINYRKTSATMIRGTAQGRNLVRNLLRCAIVPFPIRYLGLQLALRPLTKAEWQPVLDRVIELIPAWQRGLIQKQGRLVLIKSVITARPVHHMLVADAPDWLLEEVQRWMRAFLWAGKKQVSGGQCLVAWDRVCMPLCYGGLGIINLKLQGLALRARALRRVSGYGWLSTMWQGM